MFKRLGEMFIGDVLVSLSILVECQTFSLNIKLRIKRQFLQIFANVLLGHMSLMS